MWKYDLHFIISVCMYICGVYMLNMNDPIYQGIGMMLFFIGLVIYWIGRKYLDRR